MAAVGFGINSRIKDPWNMSGNGPLSKGEDTQMLDSLCFESVYLRFAFICVVLSLVTCLC